MRELIGGLAMIAASTTLLIFMLYTAVRMDCQNPPKRTSLAGAMAMHWTCPEVKIP